jgi:GWxTD domain-containing protein
MQKITRTPHPLFPLIVSLILLAGLSACSGRGIKLDPESQQFYDYARLIMTEDEMAIFKHLADKEERVRFIADFWDKRDPDPDTEANEFQEEFYRRIAYANQRFLQGPPGWKTDRGRMYIYFGAPDKTEEWFPMARAEEMEAGVAVQARVRGILRWTYYRYGMAVDFYDRRGDGTYVIDDPLNQIWGDYFDALEFAKMGLDFANKERLQEFRFIDLGLVYDKAAKTFFVTVPLEGFIFLEEEGMLQADFVFTFMLYLQSGGKVDEFQETRRFSITEEELVELDELRFSIDYDLQRGKYYVDVTVDIKPDVGKTRKIFKIRQ